MIKCIKYLSILVGLLFCTIPAIAQHEHHVMDMKNDIPGDEMSISDDGMSMSSAILPTVPMQRDGSGTSWLPDTSSLPALHRQYGAWDFMLHGGIFPRYTNQNVYKGKERGASQIGIPNWFMGMGRRSIGHNGQFMMRGMFSLDRITEGGKGYPLLFQTGESWKGKPLIDRQHPHDLFGELAAAYSHSLNSNTGFFLYLGLPGEPAIGPPAFMHRPSAQNNSDAPIGHHWQDATHITFGVVTLGFQYRQFKLDSSVFTGREPDENRFNIDKPKFDSYSARISMNPSKSIALQVSQGIIKNPEVLEPDTDIRRTTASIIYDYPINMRGNWVTTFIWGINKPTFKNEIVNSHSEDAQHSFLAESNLQINSSSTYIRYELVQKSSEELGIKNLKGSLFLINAFTFGLAKKIINLGNISFTLGAQSTIYGVAKNLKSFYGTHPVSIVVFLKLNLDPLKKINH